MPFNVYLLEKGTKLSLISQVITQPQPSFTLQYDTQLLISKTIQKTSEAKCQDISASQRMKCMLDQVENKIMSTELSCLPFQYKDVFTSLYSKFPPCKDDEDVSTKNINVRVRYLSVLSNRAASTEVNLICPLRLFGVFLMAMPKGRVPILAIKLNTAWHCPKGVIITKLFRTKQHCLSDMPVPKSKLKRSTH